MKGKFLPVFIEVLESIMDNRNSFGFPRLGSLYQSPFNGKAAHRGLKNLEHRGIIKLKKDRYLFTGKGKQWLINSRYRYFRFHSGRWDKKWRIILFDIPSEMEKQRQAFRRKLKLIGCYMIQKSVFVFPYSCEEEVGNWCQDLGLTDYVDVITADSVGSKELDVKKYFDL